MVHHITAAADSSPHFYAMRGISGPGLPREILLRFLPVAALQKLGSSA
jgi:hypothetical protein